MDAVDSYIPTPPRDDSLPFLMPVDDVLTGHRPWHRGHWQSGAWPDQDGRRRGDRRPGRGEQEVRHHRHRDVPQAADYAEAGDNVGTLLRGIDKKLRRQVLAKPGSIKPHTKLFGQVYVLSKDEAAAIPLLQQQLSSSVLLPYHRRDRRHLPPEGVEMHAWRQRGHERGS